jgi:hypothetical protein
MMQQSINLVMGVGDLCEVYTLGQACCTRGKPKLNSHDRYGSSSLGLFSGNIESSPEVQVVLGSGFFCFSWLIDSASYE